MIKSFCCFQELCFKGILIHLAKDISGTCLKMKPLVFLRGFIKGLKANWPAKRTVFPSRLDHLEEGFYSKEVQFKKVCISVESRCPPLNTLMKHLFTVK